MASRLEPERLPKAAAPARGAKAGSGRLRAVATAGAIALGAMVVYSCSLIVQTSSTQCQVDGDCAQFGAGATCDKAQNVCVGPATTSSTSSGSTSSSSGTTSSSSSSTGSSSGNPCDVDGGPDAGGCWSCSPVDNSTLLNACGTGCTPFPNSRVKGLLDGGGLPPLPDAGPDGGM
jgi:hypothetical protein